MDEGEKNSFIRFLARQLKSCSRELMAYQLLVHILKVEGSTGVDELLDQARQSPLLQARFEKNFEGFDELLPPDDPDHSEKVRKLLEKWTPPEGLPN